MKYLSAFALFFWAFNAYSAGTQWIDFTLDRGHVFLPITVEGVETQVMLDSGAQVHGINKAFIGKNHLELNKGGKVRIQGVHDVERRTSYNNLHINFFATDFTLDKVIETNLGHHSVGLLMGAGFFNNFIVQLNYPKKQIRLLTRDTVDMKEVSNIPSMSDRGRGMPIAEVLINGKPFWFLVDTGNSGSIIMERRYASQVGLLDDVKGSTMSRGVNGSGMSDFAYASEVGFGPYDIKDVLVSFPAKGESMNLESQYSNTGSRIKGKKVVGIIGYDLMQHFLITLDYKDGKLHVALPKES